MGLLEKKNERKRVSARRENSRKKTWK